MIFLTCVPPPSVHDRKAAHQSCISLRPLGEGRSEKTRRLLFMNQRRSQYLFPLKLLKITTPRACESVVAAGTK